MASCELSVRESTVKSLEVIFAYQADQLIRNIGNKLNLSKNEIKSLIKEFVKTKPIEVEIVKDNIKCRGRRKIALKITERCRAKVANGEQCSRKKKGNGDYCGIHLRKYNSDNGLQYGVVDITTYDNNTKQKLSKHSKNGTIVKTVSKNNSNYKENSEEMDDSDDSDIINQEFYPLPEVISDSDNGIDTTDVCIEGVTYMWDKNTNNLYSYIDEELVGVYDSTTNKIVDM